MYKLLTLVLFFELFLTGAAFTREFQSFLAPEVTNPLEDEVSASRDGNLAHVGIPAAWGSNPYAVEQTGQPVLTGLTSDQGSLYTDSSSNGYRIRKALLDMHNYVRKMESSAAKMMTKLIWDFHLEAYSYQWAQALCTNPATKWFEHSPDRSNGLPSWPYRIATGENLYTSTALRDSSEDFSDVVSKWYAEREWYDWSTGGPKVGATQPVGHWKQLVRPQVTSVGCTVVSGCKAEGDWRTFVVCHYDYGNVGKDPYEPNYGQQTCQSCPNGMSCCESGLCAGRVPLEATGLGPFTAATEYHDGWYECSNFKRTNCSGTGASVYREVMPNDRSDLEFNQCHCGKGPEPENFIDTVSHGYFWFRNRCFQAVPGQGDDLSTGDSMYNMLEQAARVSRLRHHSEPKTPYVDNGILTSNRAPPSDATLNTTNKSRLDGDVSWKAQGGTVALQNKTDKDVATKRTHNKIDSISFGKNAQRILTQNATPPPEHVIKARDKEMKNDQSLPPSTNLDVNQGNFTLQNGLIVESPIATEAILGI